MPTIPAEVALDGDGVVEHGFGRLAGLLVQLPPRRVDG
jgi:hypothetical protein